jgi:hypothetical protein
MQIDELETIKDVEVNGKSYMIAHMDSDTGSWLLMRLMGELQSAISKMDIADDAAQAETVDNADTAQSAIQFLLMNLDQPTFKIVQRHALNVCYRYETVGGMPKPMPVILSNGKLCYKDLQHDIKTLLELTSQALFANLSPFFSKDGLKAMLTGN